MTAGLETFAKVRALHDRATVPGEKIAAAMKMQTLARKAGMTVEQAVSKLDAPTPKPAATRNIFEDLFNTPEFKARQAERAAGYAKHRAEALNEYGSEDAVWAQTEREAALERACKPFITRKPIIGGEIDTLRGWDGGDFEKLPADVREAIANAYTPPETVTAAWSELKAWEKLADDRTAFFDSYDHDVRVRARIYYLEHRLDTLPATGMRDLRTRLDWMEEINGRGYSRDVHEDSVLLATLRADIERMGQRIREQDQGGCHHGIPFTERERPIWTRRGSGIEHPPLIRRSAEISADPFPRPNWTPSPHQRRQAPRRAGAPQCREFRHCSFFRPRDRPPCWREPDDRRHHPEIAGMTVRPVQSGRRKRPTAGRNSGGKSIPPRTLQSIEIGLAALLVVAELHSPETPAGSAYVSAIRRRGEEAFELAGSAGLDQLRRRLAENAAPDRKAKRDQILDTAWMDIT